MTPLADLAIAKTSTPHPYLAGVGLTYTVGNNGPSDVMGAHMTDNVPAVLTATTWTCTITTGAGGCSAASGSGNAVAPKLDLGKRSRGDDRDQRHGATLGLRVRQHRDDRRPVRHPRPEPGR